jgi:Ca2+-binding RTX toxin-like protein
MATVKRNPTDTFNPGSNWGIATKFNLYSGSSGADTYTGNSGVDWIFGNGGDDTLNGAGGNDWIGGGDGIDRIFGGTGNDTIAGGLGFDHMSGNAGADTFLFMPGDLGAPGYLLLRSIDWIDDFQSGVDTIDLGALAALSANGLFFDDNDGASHEAGEVMAFTNDVGTTHLTIDFEGNGQIDLLIYFSGAESNPFNPNDLLLA